MQLWRVGFREFVKDWEHVTAEVLKPHSPHATGVIARSAMGSAQRLAKLPTRLDTTKRGAQLLPLFLGDYFRHDEPAEAAPLQLLVFRTSLFMASSDFLPQQAESTVGEKSRSTLIRSISGIACIATPWPVIETESEADGLKKPWSRDFPTALARKSSSLPTFCRRRAKKTAPSGLTAEKY